MPNKNSFFEFDKLALILGFIVDTITIGGILLSISLPNISVIFPAILTSGLAFVIWLLAAYTYFAYLHHFWEKNRYKAKLADRFSIFLINDLMLKFKLPFVLFPFFILLVIKGWIIFVISGNDFGFLGGFLFVVAIGGFSLFAAKDDIEKLASNTDYKLKVDANWAFLRNRIKNAITDKAWLNTFNLHEITDFLGFSDDSIEYAFAKYAFEHPDEAKYGVVFRLKDKKRISPDDMKVLINVTFFEKDKYVFL